jgi:MFS family permease
VTARTAARRVADYFGLQRNLVLVLGMAVFIGVGERIGGRFLPKYIEALGAGAIIIGVYGALENFLGAAWAYPGGYLADRYGVKRCLGIVNATAFIGFVIVVLFPAWYMVLLGAVFFMGWSAFSLPATLKLVTDQLPRSRRAMGVSMHSMIRRVPMALGPLLGGALITALGIIEGVRVAFGVAAVFAVLAILLQRYMLPDVPSAGKAPGFELTSMWHALNPSLRRLLVSDILVRFCEQIPNVFVVLWVMDIVGQTAFSFGALTAVEMATAAALYIPVAHFSDRAERKPFVVATFVFFTLFPVVLYFSRGLGVLYVAFVVRGLKEFGEPTRKALIAELATEAQRGRTVGFYYTVRDAVVTLAPLIGGVLWKLSPAWNLWAAAAFGAAGTLYFALFGREVLAETKS